MAFSEEIIASAVERYERERDRYIKLAARVADICRANIIERDAIRAQITSRTKTVRSFENKLKRFSKRADRNYVNADAVFENFGDFAGVRVAAYRPEDEGRIAEIVQELFTGAGHDDVEIDFKDKLDPENAQFYRATHCQVFLREEELVGDYANLKGTSCEIQVCSMMAHVWNEIEHDIGYKPEGGGPGAAEHGLLEVLGHLTRSGDAAITRLLAANMERLKTQTGDFTDVHDFVAQLRRHFPDGDLSVNAGPAFELALRLGLTSIQHIENKLGKESLNPDFARRHIEKFNRFLEISDQTLFLLYRGSADLLLISLLALCAADPAYTIEISPKSGRPNRLDFLLQQYERYSNDVSKGGET